MLSVKLSGRNRKILTKLFPKKDTCIARGYMHYTEKGIYEKLTLKFNNRLSSKIRKPLYTAIQKHLRTQNGRVTDMVDLKREVRVLLENKKLLINIYSTEIIKRKHTIPLAMHFKPDVPPPYYMHLNMGLQYGQSKNGVEIFYNYFIYDVNMLDNSSDQYARIIWPDGYTPKYYEEQLKHLKELLYKEFLDFCRQNYSPNSFYKCYKHIDYDQSNNTIVFKVLKYKTRLSKKPKQSFISLY